MAQERVEGFCFFAHFFAFSPSSTDRAFSRTRRRSLLRLRRSRRRPTLDRTSPIAAISLSLEVVLRFVQGQQQSRASFSFRLQPDLNHATGCFLSFYVKAM